MFPLVRPGPSGLSGLPVVFRAQVVTAAVLDTVKMDRTVLAKQVKHANVPKHPVPHGPHGSSGVVAA